MASTSITGRQYEALALRWDNVDLKANSLVVMEAIKDSKDDEGEKTVIGNPKTHRGLRAIPFSPELSRDTYSFVLPNIQGAAVTSLDQLLSGSSAAHDYSQVIPNKAPE
ncbi:MAG: hypothetical protein GX977_06240 [Firmicutes bacterium]|jgi:hypothetical protein|nr:hypothetical protein [Bacillota bacterium]